ncbi:MAG: hypothetical protein EA382_14070 [Spirochaetaceae bacterium]|nr:MAG: hypothetical protein EA382_14070 [Spirochaetaceae bacterium]
MSSGSPAVRAGQKRLSERIELLPGAHVQNKLMATNDRNLALALLGCDDALERSVFDRIAPRKADRVRSELAVIERRHVDPAIVLQAVSRLLDALDSNARADDRSSYWRPRNAADGAR